MSQDSYHRLISRILVHCRQVAREIGPPTFGWIRQGKEWVQVEVVGQYVPEHKSFLALEKPFQGQELLFTFPPATEEQLNETEQQLGFSIPLLLRLLYTRIANGGFGPGYGITGVSGGYPFRDVRLYGDIAQAYLRAVHNESEYRQAVIQEFLALPPEEQEARKDSGNPFPPSWPKHMLPLCQWGCNVSTYIDAKTGHIFQGMSRPTLFVAASLEEWLERWLAGESLQFL